MTVAGLILAGGRGSRMGRREKFFLPCSGGTFGQRILDALAPLPVVRLSVREEEPFRDIGLPLVADRYPDTGPMGGICTALEQCSEEALFVVACDMPHLNRETVERLLKRFQKTGSLTVAWTDRGPEPLLGIYPRTVLPEIRNQMAQKQYRMRDFLARVPLTSVLLDPDSKAADNINTTEEYRALLQAEEPDRLLRIREEC